ncbi:MAG: hypothetical protein K0Q87_3324 [Neobacillus sp.]|jgi:hypothetical protein|nr:hypothetical protein [Neobacillus sp.]
MTKIVKRAIVCSLLVGMGQFGLAGTATIEASPKSNEWHQQQQQFNNGRGEQQRLENSRHEREMKRRDNESDKDWNDRQWRENQQHSQYTQQENDRQYRYNLERERHEREMVRRDHESDKDWNDRQWRENQQHNNTMNQILAGVIGIAIGAHLN